MKYNIRFFSRIKKWLKAKRLENINVILVQHLDQVILDNTGVITHQSTDYERRRETENS